MKCRRFGTAAPDETGGASDPFLVAPDQFEKAAALAAELALEARHPHPLGEGQLDQVGAGLAGAGGLVVTDTRKPDITIWGAKGPEPDILKDILGDKAPDLPVPM